MRQIDFDALIEQLLPIARLAGDAIMALYVRGSTEIQHKEDDSPVTEADLAAHRVLAAQLAPLLLDCPVVSEEDDGSQAFRQRNARFWLIDPLDGTKEFIALNGEFTVNIALVVDGQSVLGVVYAPAMDAMYWGGLGLGAFRCVANEKVAIEVSAGEANSCRVVASKSHLNEETQSFIDRLGAVSLIHALEAVRSKFSTSLKPSSIQK